MFDFSIKRSFNSYSFNIINNSNSSTIINEKTALARSIVGRVMNSSIITKSSNSNTGRIFARGTEVFQFGTYNNASGDKFPSRFKFENSENWKKFN